MNGIEGSSTGSLGEWDGGNSGTLTTAGSAQEILVQSVADWAQYPASWSSGAQADVTSPDTQHCLGDLRPLPIVGEPFSQIAMDKIGPLATPSPWAKSISSL